MTIWYKCLYHVVMAIYKCEFRSTLGTYEDVGNIVGVTESAVKQWPDPLPQRIADRVIGAAVRNGKQIPPNWLEEAAA